MKQEFRLADIGEGLEEAEIIAWRVQVGDVVERDAALVEVMTDKSNADLPAPWSGTVVSLGGSVGDMLRVGQVVAVIDDGVTGDTATTPGVFEAAVQPAAASTSFFSDTASTTSSSAEAPTLPAAAHAVDQTDQTVPADQVPSTPRRAKASPTTRREAARRGIDIAALAGSGPGGRVLLADLDALSTPGVAANKIQAPPAAPASAAPVLPEPQATTTQPARVADPSKPAPARQAATTESAQREPGVEPLRGVRRLIARNMTTSWQQVPHIHAWREIDAEPLVDLRERLRDSGRDHYQRLTPVSFFVSAVAQALRTFPVANSSLDMTAETITTHAHINIGIAVASPQGLVVPVIADADRLSLGETATQIAELVDRARVGQLGAEAFRGGTATVTNFGSLGGENATPILRPPESVIVGFGSIAPRPFVIDSAVVARQTMNVVVAADHRLLDGDVTTAFLNHVCERLIDPVDLALGL